MNKKTYCTCSSGFYGNACQHDEDTWVCSEKLSGIKPQCNTTNTDSCVSATANGILARACNCKAGWEGDICSEVCSGGSGCGQSVGRRKRGIDGEGEVLIVF